MKKNDEVTVVKAKKPFHKKWWVWLIAAIVVIIAVSPSDTPVTEGTPTVKIADETSEPIETPVVEEKEVAPKVEVVKEPVKEVAPPAPKEPKLSISQKNAIKKAESYLAFSAFSKSGLIEQLKYEGFPTDEATFAVDNMVVDWNEQAGKKAESYLEFSSFSRSGLIEQLQYEGFSSDEANHGANHVGI